MLHSADLLHLFSSIQTPWTAPQWSGQGSSLHATCAQGPYQWHWSQRVSPHWKTPNVVLPELTLVRVLLDQKLILSGNITPQILSTTLDREEHLKDLQRLLQHHWTLKQYQHSLDLQWSCLEFLRQKKAPAGWYNAHISLDRVFLLSANHDSFQYQLLALPTMISVFEDDGCAWQASPLYRWNLFLPASAHQCLERFEVLKRRVRESEEWPLSRTIL